MKKSTVLIVDDIPKNLQVLTGILHTCEINTYAAFDGYQALEIVEESPPDLILLDIMMPEMDGMEVCQKIKTNPATKNIPIIFLTAKSQQEDIIKGLKCGAVDYVTKPFESEELLTRIKTHLELKKSKEIIERQNKELKELNATKDKFFSIIAHDLKNPYNTLFGFSDLLLNSIKNKNFEKSEKFAHHMITAIKKGYDLLDNLLHWSRAQIGHIDFYPENTYILNIITDTIDIFAPIAKQKKIKINIQLSEQLQAYADKNMLFTIVRNLISNAVKFTSENGKIDIIANEKNGFIEISVKDTGKGIPEKGIKKLFRIDESYTTHGTQNEKGTGLGLILCKEFVEKNGGKITIKSQPDKGSTFTFTLPTAK